MKKSVADVKWIEAFLKKAKAFVLKGDYKGGLALAREALKRYPDDFDCRFQYAKLLGDWADELPAAECRKKKAEALRILKPLTRALSGKTAEQRFGLCLNYYYQSQDYPGMARWGRRFAAQGERKGWYAQGLGCALRAQQLHARGDGRARAWARKSLAAWKRYGLAGERYYFPHYAQAMAFAIAGDSRAGMASLKTAARASKRTIDDWEFADVLKILKSA